MSERERQRRLHVECRLEELRAKYGRAGEALEEWGEVYFANWGKDTPNAGPTTPRLESSAPVDSLATGAPASPPIVRVDL